MKPALLKETIKAMYSLRRTLCIEGAPGGGKTSIVRQVAEEMGVPYVEVHLPTRVVEDFGIPMLSGTPAMGKPEVIKYMMPDWYPVKGVAPDEGILCFDDRNQAGPDLQKVLANIAQAKTLHGVPMADWMVVSTGNRQSDRAGAGRVLSHLRDRENVVTLTTNREDCLDWARHNNVHEAVMAYWNFRPDQIHAFDPQVDVSPTPRSWVEGVADLIDTIPKAAEYEVFAGAVGEGCAAEFCGFLRIYRELPDPDEVLKAPKKAAVPTDAATLCALTMALSQRVTAATMDNFAVYLDRLLPEYSSLAMTLAVRRDASLTGTKAFASWAVNNSAYIF